MEPPGGSMGSTNSSLSMAQSIGVRFTSVMPEDRPVVMNVNRPFVFAIVDSETADILFAGKIGTIEK